MGAKIPSVNLKLQYRSIHHEVNAAIEKVLERQAFILGPEVKELEEAVAESQACSHAIGCASGSDALLLSLLALGIGAGDRVLTPPFTFFATGGAVARAGATPVYVDIDARTFNISPAAVEKALAALPAGSVKAIMPVHLYGQCADMEALGNIARQHNLVLIEDAAQAIRAHYAGQAAGSMGVCGCFSFFPTKNLGGCGDGGMITTNDAGLAERLRSLRVHGSVKKYVHAYLGMNSRLDNLQAAILLVKMRHLPAWTEARQQKAAFYRQAFLESGLSDPAAVYPSAEHPVVLPYVAPSADHVYHQFTLRVPQRDELSQHLAGQGIETVVYYPLPLHLQGAFAYLGGKAGDCPESERAAREVLSIPIFPEITEEEQLTVVEEIKGFYGKAAKTALSKTGSVKEG